MSYKELRPASLRINPDLDELPFAFEALCFPGEWRRTLLEVHAMVHQRDREKSSLSITDLNKTIRALVPDLVSINRYAGQAGTVSDSLKGALRRFW